ncbi:MAG: hypothetical protein PSV17_04600 [Methylotenera sp.]|nr:hypothetical protein [Methylotenera sp.]MDI1308699.1 hypothetical protein [Methylotenera sp.]
MLLQRVVTKIADYLAENPTHNEPTLLNFYFEALQFPLWQNPVAHKVA